MEISVVVGLYKSLGIKQQDDGTFLLGGAYESNSSTDRDMFMQSIAYNGLNLETKTFENPGMDCSY